MQLVEDVFDVKVLKVNSLILTPKRRRLGKFKGFKHSYKRMFVTLLSPYFLTYYFYFSTYVFISIVIFY